MLKFVAARLVQAVPTVAGIAVLAFVLIHAVPGDPGRIALGGRAPQSAVDLYNHAQGLDKPLPSQFGSFIGGAVRLDFGSSTSQNQAVSEVIRSRWDTSAVLILYSLAIALALSIPTSVVVAVRQGGITDHAVRAVGLALFAMPPFWLGLLLVLGLALQLSLFPVSGYEPGLVGSFNTLTLPALTLGLALAPLFIRTLRASLIESLHAGFVEAAYARGLSRRRVLYRHVLRASAIPLITLVGVTVGALFSGTVIVENVFGISGLGDALVTAVRRRDFALVQGLVVVLGVAVVLVNLATDVAYGFFDPRVRSGAAV